MLYFFSCLAVLPSYSGYSTHKHDYTLKRPVRYWTRLSERSGKVIAVGRARRNSWKLEFHCCDRSVTRQMERTVFQPCTCTNVQMIHCILIKCILQINLWVWAKRERSRRPDCIDTCRFAAQLSLIHSVNYKCKHFSYCWLRYCTKLLCFASHTLLIPPDF
jgi:hypothetical protein